MSHSKHPGQVEITFRYSRHVGPKFVHGGLTLQFDALQPYAFVSRAQWPGDANYEEIDSKGGRTGSARASRTLKVDVSGTCPNRMGRNLIVRDRLRKGSVSCNLGSVLKYREHQRG